MRPSVVGMNLRGVLRRGYGLLSAAPAPRPAPLPTEPTEPTEHAVHFYARDEALLTRLEEYVLEGLGLDEVVVVIATPEHRQQLRERLAAWELEEAFLGLDAAEMLSRFMLDGLPDATRFEANVGTLLRSHPRLRAYGEMVALLWADGNVAGTLALEQMWTHLQQEVAFPLLCAYPLEDIEQDLGSGLAQVCRLHTHVHRLAA
jgi:hypothetical protein